jgi:uncharacterized protein (UPF0332 family)
MGRSQEDLVRWAINKAEQYFQSAKDNLAKGRLYPAAEDIFRTMETSLEALLYYNGIKKIEYPGKKKKFIGRLALQFLIRDTLLKRGKIKKDVYDKYLELATDLHSGGYEFGKYFEKNDLSEALEFVEDFLLFVITQTK